MGDDNDTERGENLSTVGSGRVDALFDELEAHVETTGTFADDVASLRRRIEANEGETSGHVRNRVNDDATQLADDAEAATAELVEELRRLKRTV